MNGYTGGVSGIKIDYLVIYILLLAVVFYAGNKLSKSKNHALYWQYSLPLIVVYSLVEGLRYLRGTDYGIYAYTYLGFTNKSGYLFQYLNESLLNMSVPFYGAFVVYSFIWIIAVVSFFRYHKKFLKWGLPLFVISQLYYTENFVRQYVAFSFILVSLNFYIENKLRYFIGMSVVASLIHPVSFAFSLLIILIDYIKKPISLKVSLPLYIFIISFSLNDFYNSVLLVISNSLDSFIGDDLGHYVEQSNRWFGEDALSERYSKSLISNIGMWAFDISLITLGYFSLQKETYDVRFKVLIYNLFVYGAIGFEIFMNIELLRRFVTPFYAFWPLVFIISMANTYKGKMKEVSRYLTSYILVYIIAYHIVKNIFLDQHQMFIWDMGSQIGLYQPFF